MCSSRRIASSFAYHILILRDVPHNFAMGMYGLIYEILVYQYVNWVFVIIIIIVFIDPFLRKGRNEDIYN
jgi:uncharacterized membrane protein